MYLGFCTKHTVKQNEMISKDLNFSGILWNSLEHIYAFSVPSVPLLHLVEKKGSANCQQGVSLFLQPDVG